MNVQMRVLLDQGFCHKNRFSSIIISRENNNKFGTESNWQNKRSSMRQKIKPGSPTLFFVIRILNAIFGVTAVCLIALSGWLWKQFGTFSIVEIVFMLLGVVEILLVILVFTAKRSVGKLRCFLFFMAILFLAELVAVIVIGATGQDTAKTIINDEHSKQQIDSLKDKLNVVVIFCGVALIVMALQILCVKCYIGSLRDQNNYYDYKYVDSSGEKLTIDQRNRQIKEQVGEKWSKRREDLANKYANMRSEK